MSPPPGWTNPIQVAAGQQQAGVDARLLLPGRSDLVKARLDHQRALLSSGQPRFTPIEVTPDGVIWDGHHMVRAAAEAGLSVTVLVVDESAPPVGLSILQLPVR